jgi:anhydro-N-acetylmuramic acid kinase
MVIYMNKLFQLTKKPFRLAIGLMSGTCTDGIDAALVRIEGYHTDTRVELMEFITIPYDTPTRTRLLELASGTLYGSEEVCQMNFLLGTLLAEACLEVCKKAGIPTTDIDFVGSHGHTIFHQPNVVNYLGHSITSTLQIGEASLISEALACPVISDFRVRDMAAGGQGAPLVPYTEFLIYSRKGKAIALQNIGGIGNITFLPEDNCMDHIIAFDTGPGNMIIDALVALYTGGSMNYDEGGAIAGSAAVHTELLNWLLQDPYLYRSAPKTTGREYYGSEFVTKLLKKAEEYALTMPEIIATATMFTARSVEISIAQLLPRYPNELIVGGGGSLNLTLMEALRSCLPACRVITNEDLGLNSNAKEAVAFAVLANETLFESNNTVPTATGARHSVVMGKITL